jgi:2-phospho-L-lactate guanylyltransferase
VTTCPVALVVPVKAFRAAKARLAPLLGPHHRAALSRLTASLVVAAAGEAEPYVVCDDDEVAEWASAVGATVVWRPGLGLNAAVGDAVATVLGLGHPGVVVAHADLPLAHDLDGWYRPDEVVLVPDLARDGTNVMCLPGPVAAGFRFEYGPGSFLRHLRAARATGAAVRVVADDRLGLDIDTPEDLHRPLLVGLLEAITRPPTGTATWTPPPTNLANHPS